MGTKNKTFIAFIILCLFTSCHSNAIYFDIEQQTIVRCNGTISNLYITSKDYEDELNFIILQGKRSSNTFSVKELNKDYSIEVMHTHIDLQNFKLRPNTEYEIINHSNGDAPDGKLIIRTNQKSIVIYADKTSCE